MDFTTLETQQDRPDWLVAEPIEEPGFAGGGFERVQQRSGSCLQVVDTHSKIGVRLYYLHVALESAPRTINIFSAATINRALEGREFGLLLRVSAGDDGQCTVWLPSAPTQLCFDQYQRIVASSESPVTYQWEFQPHVRLRLLQPTQVRGVAVVPYVVLKFCKRLHGTQDQSHCPIFRTGR